MRKVIVSIISFILCISCIFSLCACSSGTDKDSSETSYTNETKVVWTSNTELSLSLYTYLLNSYYRNFIKQNQSNLESLGVDTTKDLNEQIYDESTGTTWYGFIVYRAYNELSQMLAIYDYAVANGETLSDDGKDTVEKTIDQYKTEADNYKMSLDEYFNAMFTDSVDSSVVRAGLEMQTLVSEHYNALEEDMVYTDDDLEEYYNENKNAMLHYDYIKITVPEEDVTSFTSCSNDTEFLDVAKTVITKNNFDGDYESNAETIDRIVKNKILYRCGYNEESDFCKWVFEDGRKAYDIWTLTDETSGKVTIAMLLPVSEGSTDVLYRDETPLRNIMYLLFDDEATAQEKYSEWIESGAEESKFEELLSSDNGGKAVNINGGSFSGVLREWLFDEGNVPGSHGIVNISGAGSYILYMMDFGEEAWKTDAREALKEAKYQEIIKGYEEKYPCEYDGDIIYNAKIATFSTSSTSES